MTTHTDELRRRYRAFLAPQDEPDQVPAGAEAATLAVPAESPPSRTGLLAELIDLFRQRPGLRSVVLTVGGDTIGVAHRSTLELFDPDALRGDCLSGPMPGPPVRFTALYFRCPHPPCPNQKILLFVDGAPPECDRHGPMIQEA
ncbi:hypothetical protein [Streptantibioticus silvisoli]|uniref:Uncharacterized protein n=1 Tax=Streptantibioticus silvisoli TaxID=2705255 RepID=A0ABT6VYY7_9ACTN|nr:hypothetical protein [Streptantibioticus silvisoli]MDI5963259.1 hypothetical protein [Streptantibioticus silvisoli]